MVFMVGAMFCVNFVDYFLIAPASVGWLFYLFVFIVCVVLEVWLYLGCCLLGKFVGARLRWCW